MVTRSDANLACETLEATIRSQRRALDKGAVGEMLESLRANAGPADENALHAGERPDEADLAAWELGIEALEAQYDEAHSAFAEGNYFADGRFRHPVDHVRAEQKWSRAVAIVDEALAVRA